MNQKKSGRFRRKIVMVLIGLAVLFMLVICLPIFVQTWVGISKYGFSEKTFDRITRSAKGVVWYWTASLVPDEEIISNFNAHREDFERLTQLYLSEAYGNRLHVFKGEFASRNTPETLRLLERTGIHEVVGTSAGGLWLPNPYSVETAQLAKKQSVLRANPYEALIFYFSEFDRYEVPSLRYRKVCKSLYYVPVQPKIENGELLWPVGIDGSYGKKAAVVSSLNHYPSVWGFESTYKNQCVYRQIEEQWFIKMCRD